MKTKYGMWKISIHEEKGKCYINSLRSRSIGHTDINSSNGLLIYDYENLKDLAIAIIKFEEEFNKRKSIMETYKGMPEKQHQFQCTQCGKNYSMNNVDDDVYECNSCGSKYIIVDGNESLLGGD